MARYDDLNTPAIAYTAFVSSILLLIIILLGRALCYAWVNNEDERKLADSHYATSDRIISQQKEALSGYQKVQVEVTPSEATNAEGDMQIVTEERVHIPIDQAKELLLKELKQEPKT